VLEPGTGFKEYKTKAEGRRFILYAMGSGQARCACAMVGEAGPPMLVNAIKTYKSDEEV
jgi:hypothetical protein